MKKVEGLWDIGSVKQPTPDEILESMVLPLLARHGFLTSAHITQLLPEQPPPVPYVPVHLMPELRWGENRTRWLLESVGQKNEWVGCNQELRDGRGMVDYWWVTEEGKEVSRVEPFACRKVDPEKKGQWQHTLCVNDYGAAAHKQSGGAFGPYDWEPERYVTTVRYGKVNKTYRADALLRWPSPSGVKEQYLELDRGTHPVNELTDKQKAYRNLKPKKGMPAVPQLVWCFDDMSTWFHEHGGPGHRMGRLSELIATSEKAPAASRHAAAYDANTLVTTLTVAQSKGIGWTLLGKKERSLWLI